VRGRYRLNRCSRGEKRTTSVIRTSPTDSRHLFMWRLPARPGGSQYRTVLAVGFEVSPLEPLTLMATLADIQAATKSAAAG